MEQTKMEEVTERHLPKIRASSSPLVSVTKTYTDEMKRDCRLSAKSVAFLSSRIEETESKHFRAAGARVEFGRLMDVETRGVSGLEDKLVCSFKLAADVVRGEVCQFMYDANRPAFLEGDLVGLCVNGN